MKVIWNLPKVHLISLDALEEKRPVALVYSGPAWQAVATKLHLPVIWKAEVFEATVANWDSLAEGLQGEVVYAVGGGLTADAAKYMANKFALPLVVIPTASRWMPSSPRPQVSVAMAVFITLKPNRLKPCSWTWM